MTLIIVLPSFMKSDHKYNLGGGEEHVLEEGTGGVGLRYSPAYRKFARIHGSICAHGLCF